MHTYMHTYVKKYKILKKKQSEKQPSIFVPKYFMRVKRNIRII